MNPNKTILIQSFRDDLVAQLATEKLKENNIPFHLANDFNFDNDFSKKLYVRKEDITTAQSIISDIQEGHYNPEHPLITNLSLIDSPMAKFAKWVLILFIISFCLFYLYFEFIAT